MPERAIAPPITDAVNLRLELKLPEIYQLDNGVPVYAIHAGAEDVMMTELVFFAGNCFEEKNLVAPAVSYMLRNGTTHRKAFDINEHFEYYGSFLNRACYHETATVTLHNMSRHIGELLPVVAELITDSVFPQEELDIYKQNQKQRLSVNLKKSDFVAGRLIDAYLYGEHHPYGKYSSHADYDATDREELLSFFDSFYRHGSCMIFVAGKLPAELPSLLNRYFGKLDLKSDFRYPDNPPATDMLPGEKNRIVNDPGGVQGSIRIARSFPNRHHPDFQKVMVLNNILGGYFGSRLMTNIREEKGYTYGIYSYLQNHIQHSAWMVSTEAGKDVSEAAVDEIYKEMAKLREEPVSEEELQLVRNYMMGTILGDLDGPFQIIARWKNYVLNKLDEKYFYNSIHTIRSVTAEELQALAVKYLNPGEFYELIVT